MKINYLIVLLLLFAGFGIRPVQAQKEASNWYFGNKAGIHFNASNAVAPNPLTDSKMTAIEGCAAISDSSGNLLFYTAGDTVYNAQHRKMNNGWLLSGHQSATQSSLIIRQPGSYRLYYLFTADAVGGPAGLKYSVIDIKALNGEGRVIAKNVPLVSPVAEKITAVDHRSTNDIWVITHGFGPQNGNKFYAYRVSANGVANPVISTTGATHGPVPEDAVGALKASPDGTKLALALESRNLVETFDFNDETGVVKNPMTFANLKWAYGVEFTPDGSQLFASFVLQKAMIMNFNMLAARFDRDSIEQTASTVGVTDATEGGSLQLGPNYMIYMALPHLPYLSTLGTINSPVFKPAYRDKSLNLDPATPASRISRQGLPAFNQSMFYRPHFKANTACIGDTTFFKIPGIKQFKSIRWSFNDPDSGKDSVATGRNPWHIFTQPGSYVVKLTVVLLNDKVYSNAIPVNVAELPKFTLGPDVEICPNDSVKLNGPENTISYKWSTGQKTDSIYVKKPGRYYLTISNFAGCTYQDTIDVLPKPGPVIFKQKYYEMCLRKSAQIKADYKGGEFWWDNKSTDSVRTVNKVGWYKGYAKYNGCTFTDSVEVGYKECLDDLFLPNLITPNGDGQNDTFILLGLKPGTWHLQIYNRWGILIYDDKNYKNDWPKNLPADGTYYYLLQKPEISGSHKGWLEVVR